MGSQGPTPSREAGHTRRPPRPRPRSLGIRHPTGGCGPPSTGAQGADRVSLGLDVALRVEDREEISEADSRVGEMPASTRRFEHHEERIRPRKRAGGDVPRAGEDDLGLRGGGAKPAEDRLLVSCRLASASRAVASRARLSSRRSGYGSLVESGFPFDLQQTGWSSKVAARSDWPEPMTTIDFKRRFLRSTEVHGETVSSCATRRTRSPGVPSRRSRPCTCREGEGPERAARERPCRRRRAHMSP